MNTVTHALMPVGLSKLGLGEAWRPKRWEWLALAVAGAAPDLINPHIYLEDRMTSLSHGVPAWLAFSMALVVGTYVTELRLKRRLAVLMSFAYLLHIICDAISGGVNLLYPYGDLIWGDYWIGLVWWIPIDTVLLLTCYYHFRFKGLREKAKGKNTPA